MRTLKNIKTILNFFFSFFYRKLNDVILTICTYIKKRKNYFENFFLDFFYRKLNDVNFNDLCVHFKKNAKKRGEKNPPDFYS